MSKSGTPGAKLINFGQARVERLSRQPVLPGETSLDDGEDLSARRSAPASSAMLQAGPNDPDLIEAAASRPQQLQASGWPLLEMKAAIRDLENRIVTELRGSQSPGPAAADLEREVFRIGRRLEELNELVEELRRASDRQSAAEDAASPMSNRGSLEEIAVDLARRVDSALALEQRDTRFRGGADQTRAEAARFNATAISPVSASILASLEKTADEMRFAQSTWRRNLYQRTCASEKEKVDPTAIGAELLHREQAPVQPNPRYAATSLAQQRQGDVGLAFEEMLEFVTESDELGQLGAPRNPPLKAESAKPRNASQPLIWELSNAHDWGDTRWAFPSLLEKAQLCSQRAMVSIESARAYSGVFARPFKGRSTLAIAGLILAAGGYFFFRPGVSVPKTNYESTANPTAAMDESGAEANRRVAHAADAGSAGWRGGLQKLAGLEGDPSRLNPPSQLDLTSGQAPDQSASSLSRNSTPLQLPSAPERASRVDAGDIQALADQGDAKAQYELATKLMSGHDAARNAKAAVRWLEKSANKGLDLAQLRLGIIYGKGFGVDRNLTLARKWFQAAAENGNALAMHNLAVLLSEGHGRPPDHASADVWFRKAAELGIRDSQYNLGVDYMRGLGVEKDLVQAYAWFATAAAQGDTEALKKRKEVRALLDPEELDAAKALANSLIQKQPQAEARD